jgi:hypothetical protein
MEQIKKIIEEHLRATVSIIQHPILTVIGYRCARAADVRYDGYAHAALWFTDARGTGSSYIIRTGKHRGNYVERCICGRNRMRRKFSGKTTEQIMYDIANNKQEPKK